MRVVLETGCNLPGRAARTAAPKKSPLTAVVLMPQATIHLDQLEEVGRERGAFP